MICPNCKAEYREGYCICADCGTELVSEIDQPERHDPIEYAPVLSVGSGSAYAIVHAHFEAAGIKFVPPPHLVARLRFPITIGVRVDQVDVARTLLEELDLMAGEPLDDAIDPGSEIQGQPEVRAGMGVEVEAAVVKNGRYLLIPADGMGDGVLALPGGPIASEDADEGVLEGSLRRILSARFRTDLDEHLLYVGSRLSRDRSGNPSVRILFLTRWHGGGPEMESAEWLFAGEIEGLPGASPDSARASIRPIECGSRRDGRHRAYLSRAPTYSAISANTAPLSPKDARLTTARAISPSAMVRASSCPSRAG